MKIFFAMVLLVLAVFFPGIDGNVQPALGEERLFLGAVKNFLSDDGFFTCRVCRKSYPFDDFFTKHYEEAGHCQKNAGVETCYCCACDNWIASYKIHSHTFEHKKVLEERHEYFRKKKEANDPKPVSDGARKHIRRQADAYRDTHQDLHRW